jgi:hypothetical protein
MSIIQSEEDIRDISPLFSDTKSLFTWKCNLRPMFSVIRLTSLMLYGIYQEHFQPLRIVARNFSRTLARMRIIRPLVFLVNMFVVVLFRPMNILGHTLEI